MADYERPILAAEEKFFNECNTGNGKLPHSEWYHYDSDMIVGECLQLLC